MLNRRSFLKVLAAAPAAYWLGHKATSLLTAGENAASGSKQIRLYSAAQKDYITSEKVIKTPSEWKQILDKGQYRVLRDKGTEMAFTGKLYNTKEKGIYQCAGCRNDLFDSNAKFDSGTGWPSFYQPIAPENVEKSPGGNFLYGTEVHCARCEGHLGHIFNDGPRPTGLRYCINSVALIFTKL